MSDNALTSFELEKVFISWKSQYGEEGRDRHGTPYKCVPFKPAEARKQMYRILVQILIEQYNYDKEDFTEMLAIKVIDASTDYSKDKSKLSGWKAHCRNDWLSFVDEIFPTVKNDVKVAARVREEPVLQPEEVPFDPAKMERIRKEVAEQEAMKGKGLFPKSNTVIDEDEDLLAGLEDEP